NAWYENRRTGYPVFTLNSHTNLNIPSTSFPLRWMYPQKELDYNSENVNAAIQSQFGGNDDFSQVMWLLK
ncbi:SusD/RagB family nutrient-binding outer membrane lipoprotein, partial [Chitinophaga sp.]|uniref:SusD/RagB family nutrient-binding outer membrane lipoprotein n=1 Tax=Chitinophaga sp. TaxID=1869181 RepID=UPI002F92AFB4